MLLYYRGYIETQEAVSHAYRDRAHWQRMAILNVARMGKFSSDRSMQDYCDRIWKAKPAEVKVDV